MFTSSKATPRSLRKAFVRRQSGHHAEPYIVIGSMTSSSAHWITLEVEGYNPG
jgi:hypothetical protein